MCRDMVKSIMRAYMSYILNRKNAFARYFEVFEVCRDMVKSITRAYMSYILNRKYAFARYFEVCKLFLQIYIFFVVLIKY